MATYLNGTLVPKGELLENYYATGHVSLDNYIAQISGQAPTPLTDSDCNLTGYSNVTPGTDDPNTATYPGQVDGNGCVYPAPTATTNGAPTIADQLDAVYPPSPATHVASWREYAEDMGNDPTRDGGVTDPLGGTDCAHPTVGGTDGAAVAEAADRYATRHNPFMYFHSIIDNAAECDANVVPLGTTAVGTPSTFNGAQLPDTFTGHLANDLSSEATTPKFGFITPNLCDDGHDATCAGTNVEGGKTGGLTAADLWLKHWMPLIMASPSYQSGQMLVVLTSDEGDISDTTACCNEQPGPNWAFPGHSPLLGAAPTTPGADPGGGRIGTLLLNSTYIQPGTVDTTGFYNHYSALRSYEDLLGLTTGGADGEGHLGFAAAAGLTPFGQDIFQPARHRPSPRSTEPVSGHRGIADLHGVGGHHDADHPMAGLGQRRGQLDQCVRGDESHADHRAAERHSRTAGRSGPSSPTISGRRRPLGDDHGDCTDDKCRAAVEQRHAVGGSVPRRHRLTRRDQGPVRGDRRNPESCRDRHRHPDHLRMADELEYDHRAERDVHPAECRVLGRAHGHQSRHHHHRQQSATDDQCRAAVEQRHAVGAQYLDAIASAGRDQGPVRGDRRKPEQRRDRHRHPDHIRMADELEYQHRAERDIHPPECRFLRRGCQRGQHAHRHLGDQLRALAVSMRPIIIAPV